MDALEGQVAVEVGCNCEQTVLVVAHMVEEWKCGRCRAHARPTGRTIVLGERGALPAGWSDQLVDGAAA